MQVHCEALGKGLWDGDPGPLTPRTHLRALPFMCAPLHVAPQLPIVSEGNNSFTPPTSAGEKAAFKLPSICSLTQAPADFPCNPFK